MYLDHKYFISEYEKQYMAILKDIYENGYEDARYLRVLYLLYDSSGVQR